MEFIDKIRSVELKPTLQLGHHPPQSNWGGCPFERRWGGVCLNWNNSDTIRLGRNGDPVLSDLRGLDLSGEKINSNKLVLLNI